MAWYDSDWRWHGEGSAPERGGEGRWREHRRSARRPGSGAGGYGTPYRGRPPIGERSIRAAAGTGYDYDYEGGEWGSPVNAPGFGTRGSYGTPTRPGSARSRDYRYRPEGFRAGYEREFATEWPRGRWSAGGYPAGGFRPGGYHPGDDRFEATPGYQREYEEEGRFPDSDREFRRGWRSRFSERTLGTADFGGSLRRHYGRTPPDRWPGRASAWPGGRMDDEDVRESVRENLFQDSYIDPDRIEVHVDRGVVTLRGEVDDFLEARYAWDDAWDSPGVRGVINHLTVRTDRASDEMDMPQSTGSESGEGENRSRGRGRRGR